MVKRVGQPATHMDIVFIYLFSISEIIIIVSSGLPDKVFYDKHLYNQVKYKKKCL